MEVEVTNTASAVLRITGTMGSQPVVRVELRRPPRLNDVVLARLLRQTPNVRAVARHPEGGFRIQPVTSINPQELKKLVADLVTLANIIV